MHDVHSVVARGAKVRHETLGIVSVTSRTFQPEANLTTAPLLSPGRRKTPQGATPMGPGRARAMARVISLWRQKTHRHRRHQNLMREVSPMTRAPLLQTQTMRMRWQMVDYETIQQQQKKNVKKKINEPGGNVAEDEDADGVLTNVFGLATGAGLGAVKNSVKNSSVSTTTGFLTGTALGGAATATFCAVVVTTGAVDSALVTTCHGSATVETTLGVKMVGIGTDDLLTTTGINPVATLGPSPDLGAKAARRVATCSWRT